MFKDVKDTAIFIIGIFSVVASLFFIGDMLNDPIQIQINHIEEKIDTLEEKIDTKVGGLEEKIDTKVGGLEEKIDNMAEQNKIIIQALKIKGIHITKAGQ